MPSLKHAEGHAAFRVYPGAMTWLRGTVVALGVACASCTAPPRRTPPHAVEGVMDLHDWDFDRDGSVALDGTWDLFWGQRFSGDVALAGDARDAPPERHSVPFAFDDLVLHDGARPGPHGVATMRLRVRMPPVDASKAVGEGALTLSSSAMDSSFRLDVRDETGRPLGQPIAAGTLGTDAATARGELRSGATSLAPAHELVLHLQVSDFEAETGVVRPPRLSTTEDYAARVLSNEARELLLVGAIFMMGIYHLILYALRRLERAPLWFGLFTFGVGTRAVFFSGTIEKLWPGLVRARANTQIQYLSIYAAAAFFVFFLESLFPARVHRPIARGVVMMAAVWSVLELVLPGPTSLYAERAFELTLFPLLGWVLWVLGQALVRDRDTMAGRLLLGYLALGVSIANDTLVTFGVLRTPSLVAYGLFAFIVSQSVVLATLNQRARTTAEVVAKELDVAHGRLKVQNEELDAKNVALSRLDQLKDSFLANTSHELRTPLHGIIGLTESLLDGVRGALTEGARAELRLIVASARRLTSLVNDLLDFSKLKHKNLELQRKPVDLQALVEVVLTLSRPMARARGLTLVNDVPETLPYALADENRLQQILVNLVGNAIKFTSDGRVTVTAAETGGTLAVTVADTGIGIPKDAQERIFESFEQADGDTSREYGGTGIGLTVTRQLVELHGGVITVDSEPGKGARFTFTLTASERTPEAAVQAKPSWAPPPIARLGEEPESAPMPASDSIMPPPDGAPLVRVLAVDDDPVNLAVLESYLSPAAFAVATAPHGTRALEMLANGATFDIVLLDIMMPRLTGYEVCRRIRERQGPNELPIVLLTAKTQVADLVLGFDAGANDYLTKPFSKRELVARVLTHTDLAKTNRAYRRFVPRELITLLGKEHVTEVRLGDQVERRMSVLFSDIRFFTTMSERMSPRESFAFIDEFLRRVSPSVRSEGGFVDKYLGDGIMALFPSSADDAVRAALAMLAMVRGRAADAGAHIEMGIGVHTGDVVLGVLGEEQRMEGTVIADAVNLASRVEGCTKLFGTSFLLSGDAFGAVGGKDRYGSRPLGSVRVKGKSRATALHELFDGDEPRLREHKASTQGDFAAALALYGEGRLDEASRLFASLLEGHSDDGPARFYAARCRRLLAREAPDSAWTGVIDLEGK